MNLGDERSARLGIGERAQRAIQERLGFVEALAPHHRARRLAVQGGFSLHADTAVHGHDRQGLERLCRYGARGPVAESRLRRLDDARYEYSPKKGTAFTLTAAALVRRLVALLPPPKLHLTSHHGAYAPNSSLRVVVTLPTTASAPAAPDSTPLPGAAPTPPPEKQRPPRLDWAQLHQRTFGTDVLQCPCGGRRSIRSVHSTRKQAEARRWHPRAGLTVRLTGPVQLERATDARGHVFFLGLPTGTYDLASVR